MSNNVHPLFAVPLAVASGDLVAKAHAKPPQYVTVVCNDCCGAGKWEFERNGKWEQQRCLYCQGTGERRVPV